MPNLRNGSKGGFEPRLSRLRVRHSTTELPRSTEYHSSVTSDPCHMSVTGCDINPPMKYSGFYIILGSRVIRDYDEIACRVQIWDVNCGINFYSHIFDVS